MLDQTILNVFGLLATAILGFWLNAERADKKQIWAEMAQEKAARQALELKIAETYLPKSDTQKAFEKIDRKFEVTDAKLDEIKNLIQQAITAQLK